MPSDDPRQRFQDILDNIVRIERYIAGLDHGRYTEDSEKQDAVERCLMRICEAARKLGDGAELLCPGIPWPEIRGLGNRLRHEYAVIDISRIWQFTQKDLPPLKTACMAALRNTEDKP